MLTRDVIQAALIGSLRAVVMMSAVTAGLGACSSASDSTSSTSTSTVVPAASKPRAAPTMRELADRGDLNIGTAVDATALKDEAGYRKVLAREFNMVEAENVMKWEAIHPAADTYDFAAGDALVAFARRHDMTVRGHTLAWHQQNPKWLLDADMDRAQAIAVLRDHIQTVVGHYRGQVTQWDVVNEAVPDTGSGLRDNVWLRTIGPDYLALAFRFAHEADPAAKLFYNDYDSAGVGKKTDRILALAASLKSDGVPIDGIGIQFHVYSSLDFDKIAKMMATADRANLEVAVTEADVALKTPAQPDALAQQAERFSGLLAVCVAAPNCDTFNLWGFTDRHSWIPDFLPGFGAATPFDENLQPKPAWKALLKAATR